MRISRRRRDLDGRHREHGCAPDGDPLASSDTGAAAGRSPDGDSVAASDTDAAGCGAQSSGCGSVDSVRSVEGRQHPDAACRRSAECGGAVQ